MSAVETTEVRLADVSVKGSPVPFEVTVSVDGKFRAELYGEEYTSDRLESLQRDLADGIRAQRVSIPFLSRDGRRGTIRGWHAGRQVILVTWDDGTKGDVKSYEDVFLPGEISETEIARLAYIETTQRQLADERHAISSGAKHHPEILIAEALGLTVEEGRYSGQLRRALDEQETV